MLHLVWPIRILDPPVRALHKARITNLKANNTVKLLHCNRYLESCEGNPHGNIVKCLACSTYVKEIAKSTNIQLVDIGKYKNDISNFLTSSQINNIKDKTYNSALGTVASFEIVSSEKRLSNKGKKIAKKLFENSIKYLGSILQIINLEKSNGTKNISLNSFNGRYSTTIQHYFLYKYLENVVCHYYEVWGRKNPYLSTNAIIHDAKFMYQSCKEKSELLSKKEIDKVAEEYFFQRWFLGGVKVGEINHTVSEKNKSKFKKPAGCKLISIFPSSNFEYNFMPYGYSPVIQDIEIANFIKKLYEVSKKYFVIIRLHPNLKKSSIVEYKSFLKLEKLSKQNINVKCILPNEQISSLDLIKLSDYMVSFASFSAVEGNYLRKKVLQIGDSRYRYFNVANKFVSGISAAKALIKNEVYIKPITGSKIFACGVMIRDKNFINFQNVSGNYFVNDIKINDFLQTEKIRNISIKIKEIIMFFKKKYLTFIT